MTLIAAAANNNNPTLIGDILFTSRDTASDSYVLPTFADGTGHALVGAQRTPVMLKQKLYIVNPRICLGIAGRGDEAYSFLKAMKLEFHNKVVLDENEVWNFVRNYDREKRDSLSVIVGVLIPEKNYFNKFVPFGHHEDIYHPTFGTIYAIGSGAFNCISALRDFPEGTSRDIDGLVVPQDMESFALQQALATIGLFLAGERFAASTLLKGWGAGYEIIVRGGTSFIKVDDITVAISSGVFDSASQSIQNLHIDCVMKTKYFDETLFVRAWANGKESIFAVQEIDSDKEVTLSEDKRQTLDYGSKLFVTFYVIRHGSKIRTGQITTNNNVALSIEPDGEQLVVRGDEAYIRQFETNLSMESN